MKELGAKSPLAELALQITKNFIVEKKQTNNLGSKCFLDSSFFPSAFVKGNGRVEAQTQSEREGSCSFVIM